MIEQAKAACNWGTGILYSGAVQTVFNPSDGTVAYTDATPYGFITSTD